MLKYLLMLLPIISVCLSQVAPSYQPYSMIHPDTKLSTTQLTVGVKDIYLSFTENAQMTIHPNGFIYRLSISFENIKSYPSILKKVEKFWAYPSYDTRCPPPHSTGGALDVCLSDKDGNLVEMGSMVDQMDETSNPYFYSNIKNEEAIIWNSRRNLLREIMTKFGFAQHPNEWWHFSYGDQLWAWKNKKANALYGKI